MGAILLYYLEVSDLFAISGNPGVLELLADLLGDLMLAVWLLVLSFVAFFVIFVDCRELALKDEIEELEET
jgi:hypothetical protein